MSSPDSTARPRPNPLSPVRPARLPAPRLGRRLRRAARAAAFHVLHPGSRGPFVEQRAPTPLVRVPYATTDGWRAASFYVPPGTGGSGEPVVVAHGLGVGVDAYRYGTRDTLVGALTRAGFAVYLLTHRGDPASTGAAGAGPADFDGIVMDDLPPAIRAVASHAGFPRVHWVGHGLGGQLGLVGASRDPSVFASVCAVGAPVRFPTPRSELRRRHLALRLVPGHWRVPLSTVAPWTAPLADRVGAPTIPGPRARGLLEHGTTDLPVAMLRQVVRWVRQGRLVSRDGRVDWTAGLARGRAPLRVVLGDADPLWPPAFAEAAADRWSGPATVERVPGWTHADAVLGGADAAVVRDRLVAWLSCHRRAAWGSRFDGPEAWGAAGV